MAPRETENNAYAKLWGDKQRTLWYVMVFLEWSITRHFRAAARSRLEDNDKHKKGTFFKYENVQRTSETLGRQPENEFSGVKSLLITIKKAFIKCKLEKALRKLKFHSAPCGTI